VTDTPDMPHWYCVVCKQKADSNATRECLPVTAFAQTAAPAPAPKAKACCGKNTDATLY